MIRHGWYSKSQDQKYGHVVATTITGFTANISYVSNTSSRKVLCIKSDDDDVYVGEIDKIIEHNWKSQ